MAFTLKLFGGASLEDAAGPLAGRVVQRRRLALLALLALAHKRGVSRDKLVAYLWPGSDEERARHLLSDSLYVLRKSLGEEALLTTGDDIRLNSKVIQVDIAEFEDALERGDWERAVSVYAGPLLDGVYLSDTPEWEHWTDGERERLSRLYSRALESLAEERSARGGLLGAVEAWRLASTHEPTNSRIALRLMRALDAAGNRAGAMHHAQVHETILREELGAAPDPDVSALAEQMRRESATENTRAPAEREPAPAETEPPLDVPMRVPAQQTPPEDSDTKRAATVHRRVLRAPSRLMVSLGLLLGALTLWALWQHRPRPAAPTTYDSIAVLPFADTSPEDNEYLSDGITDELISALAQVEGLHVAARTSSFAFKGKNVDVRKVGEALGVSAVLDGSVRRVGNRLRVTAQLASAENGYQLWSETYERELSDVFTIQEEIARAIVNTVRGQLAQERPTPLVQSHTQDLEAYQLYLRGRYFWNQRDNSQRRDETLQRAVSYFRAALRRDPNYALAYSGLADTYASAPSAMSRNEAYARAKAAALRALELDETLAEAHTALARILVMQEWDWAGAGKEYRRALELNPGYATTHQWYGMYLASLGRLDEALQELKTAQRLDPLSLTVNNDLGRALYYARRYDEAIEQYRKTIQLYPNSADAHLNLALVYAETGALEAAVAELQRWSTLSGDEPQSLLGYVYAAAGRREEALRIVNSLEAQSTTERLPPVGLAAIHAHLGNRDRAFALLEQAVRERSPFVLFLKVHPRLDPLRSDPRFARLLRQVGLE